MNIMDINDENFLSAQKIVPVKIEEEMKKSYIDYAMSVIVSRALPDVRDGMKPVHRRILYTMNNLALWPEKPFRKSASIVGDAMGNYHPHGDAAIYDALVRLAQDFSLRYPLVNGHGNFGSVDNDPPAAMRYTEAKLAKIALEMLGDIDKDTVDFVPNYDDRLKEPSVLPAKLPNLLINGAYGIAVGMASNIPPHNLTEVINGTIAQIDNPEITNEELMQYIKGPDFPTAGLIVGKDGNPQGNAIQESLSFPYQRLDPQYDKRKQQNAVQPHDIPAVRRHISAQRIKNTEKCNAEILGPAVFS